MAEGARKQTLSFLMGRFEEAGIHPRTRLGQNFLIDLNLLELLAQAAELGPADVVLEVGTGTGSLTALVAPRVAAVVTVEVDRDLFHLAGEELHALGNVRMLNVDALKNKNRLNGEVLAAVGEARSADPPRPWKLVANLPYSVATPVLSNLLTLDDPPQLMVGTIQKELADRLVARPRSKDYGALAVWVQSLCEVEIVRTLPPTAFWPRPKVTSAIVRIRPNATLRGRIGDREFFHSFVRSMFFHRRKYLRSELLSAGGKQLTKPQVDAIMAAQGLSDKVRAEELDINAMLSLAEAMQQAVNLPPSA